MPISLDVCIRGDGIVGRTLALLLARERLHVGIVRQPRAPGHSDVRAYALNAASRQLLESLRAWPDAAHACAVTGMEVHGDEGGRVRFDARKESTDALAWIVDVPALEQRLAEAIKYQPLVEILEAPAPAPLTAVCEGKASATRDEFGVQYDAKPYPQKALATRVRCEKPHGGIARQWFEDGNILAFLPLAGGEGNLVAVVWSLLEPRAASLASAEAASVETQLEAASHQALGKISLVADRAVWPLQLAQADRWCGPGWALAGDAAHTVHPLAGQGLNLGLADARELAQVLRAREVWRNLGDERLLRRYERARKADVIAMRTATDGLQQLFAQKARPVAQIRNWGMSGFDRSGPIKDWIVKQAMGRS